MRRLSDLARASIPIRWPFATMQRLSPASRRAYIAEVTRAVHSEQADESDRLVALRAESDALMDETIASWVSDEEE